MPNADIKKMVNLIVDASLDEKANNIVVLDVHEQTIIADYFVIASGRNFLQVKSIIEAIEENLAAAGFKPIRRDGHKEGVWVILDYGSILVHVFRQEEREFYGLEELWGDAVEVLVKNN
ncbi:MAG TPA: ribosome silencing factor [Syntrophomonadaceae bacterium]|nr:ribosome silencing factor [Syntrophomonadaceae bacterium]